MTGTGIAGAADHGPAPDEPRCYRCGGQFKRQRGEWICHSAKIVPGKGLKEFCSEECARVQGKTGEPATDEEIDRWRETYVGEPGVALSPRGVRRLIARIDTLRERAEKAEAVGREEGASALEQRLWGIIDRDGLGDVPSDIAGAVSRLVTLSAEAAALRAEVERLRSGAIGDVAAERQRQMEAEGWTPEHDDAHASGELAQAGACYALHASIGVARSSSGSPLDWPWEAKWWKPKGRRRDLVRAAALIVAEIERLDRAALTKEPTP